jgi:uncharacterized protein
MRYFVLLTGLAATMMVAGAALAQANPAVSQALAAGDIGEQADGYLGHKATPSAALRDAVAAINIGRREAYTKLAATRGVTVKDVAAAVGCETLATRVAPGRSYLLPDGVWRVKGTTAIQLPAYCAP